MNFRFKKLKIICSVLAGLILAVIYALFIPCKDLRTEGGPQIDMCIVPWTSYVIIFIIVLLVTYLLWSLFEKKNA